MGGSPPAQLVDSGAEALSDHTSDQCAARRHVGLQIEGDQFAAAADNGPTRCRARRIDGGTSKLQGAIDMADHVDMAGSAY